MNIRNGVGILMLDSRPRFVGWRTILDESNMYFWS